VTQKKLDELTVIEELVLKNMDNLEDEINTYLRGIIDNQLHYKVGSRKWEQALEYARAVFYHPER